MNRGSAHDVGNVTVGDHRPTEELVSSIQYPDIKARISLTHSILSDALLARRPRTLPRLDKNYRDIYTFPWAYPPRDKSRDAEQNSLFRLCTIPLSPSAARGAWCVVRVAPREIVKGKNGGNGDLRKNIYIRPKRINGAHRSPENQRRVSL